MVPVGLLLVVGLATGNNVDIKPLEEPLPGYTFGWVINDTTLVANMTVQTSGWVGFGIGEAGSGAMAGADIITCYVAANGVAVISDMFAVATGKPTEDVIQDWHLVSAELSNGITTCVVARALDTGDIHEDHAIDNDGIGSSFRLLFAYGTAEAEFTYHGNNRVYRDVDLFNPGLNVTKAILSQPDYEGSIDFLNPNYAIPPAETTYWNTCFDQDPIFQDGVSIIGIGPVLQENTTEFIHHFTVYANSVKCDEADDAPGEMVFLYAPGAQPSIMPDGVGFSLGAKVNGYLSISVQTHFNNPKKITNITDNSGIRVYITNSSSLRPIEMGILQLGDPFVNMRDCPASENGCNPPHETPEKLPIGYSRYSFECPATTTSKLEGDLNVLGSLLHMHQTGVAMRTRIVRDGEVVATTSKEYYDFNFQGVSNFNTTIKPGDTLLTECMYMTTKETYFGLGSADEMCIDYVMYYPKTTKLGWSDTCGYGPGVDGLFLANESGPLSSVNDLNRTFGNISSLLSSTTTPMRPQPSSTITTTTTTTTTPTTTTATTMPLTTFALELIASAGVVGIFVGVILTLTVTRCCNSRNNGNKNGNDFKLINYDRLDTQDMSLE